jgi:HlyD family secretion protein
LLALAKVLPMSSTDLTFDTGGVVAEVYVKEGDTVSAGTPLVRLDEQSLKIQIDAAKASLAEAQALYQELMAGATPESIEAARLRLDRARAQLREVKGEVTEQDIVAAKRSLEEAVAQRERLKAGPTPQRLTAVKANLEQAQAELEAARVRASAAKTIAESEMRQAANALRDKQAEYSRIWWANRSAEESGQLSQEAIDREASAKRQVENAAEEMEQRKVIYDQGKQVEVTTIRAAEARLRTAQAQLDEVNAPLTPDIVAAADADIANARARLEKLQQDRREGRLASASLDVDLADNSLKQVTADPQPADIATAQARILRSEVNVKQAELALERSTLRAPWAGTIAVNGLRVGQAVEAREAVMTLADFSSWQLRTEDLNEVSIVHLREGNAARITFAALPGVELTGRVTRISPVGTSDKNIGATYAVTIVPDTWDGRLRWNMTASVAITTDG